VSDAFAEHFWPGEDPIGKGIGPSGRSKPPFYRVVGVVGDVYPSSLTDKPAVAVYYPVTRIPDTSGWWPNAMYLAVRTELSNPMALLPAIRGAVQEVDPSIPVAKVEEMQTIVDRSMSRLSFTMVLLGVAASVALLLAAIGLYGVISYIVARRTNEIGVRIALGAQPRQVERVVVVGSLKLAAAGLGIGLLAALGLTRLMQSLLYGVEPTHPAAYGAAALLLAGVALLASYIPARRAARVDPTVALRAE
jgi:ABC-type lipoprotein release transport system permease subunit